MREVAGTVRGEVVGALVAAALLAGAASVARAQPESLVHDPTPVVFPTLAPDGVRTQFGGQLGIHHFWTDGDNLYRLDLSGQYIWEQGLGAYATVSASRAPDETAMSNLELGVLYRIPRGETIWAVRAGVVLPTGSDDVDSLLQFASTAAVRPTDLAASAPSSTVARLGVAPTYRTEQFVVRADVGVDVFLHVGGNTSGRRPRPWLHADLGAGLISGPVTGLVEVNALVPLDDGDSNLYVAAVTAEYSVRSLTGWMTPYLTVSRPFGDLIDGSELTSLMLGLRGSL